MAEYSNPKDRALDRLHIQDLLVRCIVGINPEEREKEQDVIINVTLHADLSKACRSDDFADTIDYRSLKKRIMTAVEASADLLVERLAQRIADLCLDSPGVQRVRVRLDKPGALRFARSVAVEIDRYAVDRG
jgi:D-erythro-7,8-dihydroneopterin triphosphate epimerase